MKKTKNRSMFGIFVLTFFLLSACNLLQQDFNRPDTTNLPEGPEQNTVDQNDLSGEIEAFMQEIMQDGLPGAALAIVHGEEIIYAEGFGYRDVENQLPVTPETLFHIGSTNKSMTAMMIAALVDEGLFDWDTPVKQIYPDFELASTEAAQTVTMRHLLSMQSGIPDYAEDDFDPYDSRAEDLFDFVQDSPLLANPGQTFSYSNISVSLAGYVGVIAAGTDQRDLFSGYEQLLTEKVLSPIGMDSAVVRFSEVKNNPNYSKSYILQGRSIVEAKKEDLDGDPLAPSGVLKANVLDMAAYISTQLNHGLAPNGVQVVSEKNLLETWEPGLENYAMGWEHNKIDGMDVIFHEGAFDNYLSVIGFVPELNIGFVILTNSEETGEDLISDGPIFLLDLLRSEF